MRGSRGKIVCAHEAFTLIAKLTKDLYRVFFVLIVTGVGATFDEWLPQEGREPRSGRVWEIADLIGLLDAADQKAA